MRRGCSCLRAAPEVDGVTTMEPPASDRPLSVLLVGDDPQAARHVNDYLSARGVAVSTHTSAEGAPMLVRHARPDVVVLDLALPMTGLLALCREVRHGYANPIFVLTNHSGVQNELACLAAGADDCLSMLGAKRRASTGAGSI